MIPMLLALCLLLCGVSATAAGMREIAAALEANPRDVAALNAYGIEQAKAGDLIGAIRTWRHAIDIAPDYVHFYNNIGSALRRLGYVAESLAWYQASLRVQPTYWTWYNLGLLHEDGKRREDARRAYHEALKLCPSFSQAEERLWRLNRAFDDARTKAPVAVELPPVTPDVPAKPVFEPESVSVAKRPSPASAQSSATKRAVGKAGAEKPEPVVERETPAMYQHPLPGDSGGQVFVTFDGGADADGLVPILEALKARGLKTTFFLTGQWVNAYPDLGRRILAEGHEIANHSMRHPNMAGWGEEKIAQELGKAEQAMQTVLGRRFAPFFRFPFGAQNSRVERIVEKLGYKPVYWNIDTLDWKEPSVASIQQKVRSRVRRGSVILMHVGGKNGPKALPKMLDELLARGFRPGRLSDLDPAGIAALPRG
ncbi:MAG: Peptidoglycan-N-acetylglucosamine deacetylase [bacterium ADurb.Bin374]|nr:MAG: Peptidoglycan-N-acetylglucosamine deacetylase [bacterium ADurb.Bin374]